MTGIASLFSIVLFHFILYLLSISMAMTNLKKIELNNATEICLLSIFSIKNICFPTKLWFTLSIFNWFKPRVYIKYGQKSGSNILSGSKISNFVEYIEIESCIINKTFSLEKFTIIFSWLKHSHWFLLLIYSKWTRVKI